MIGSTKKLCTGQAGCPCKFCGQVRLLMEHERQREAAMSCQICASPAMRAELIECPLCGAPGALPEIDALAEKYIEQLERRKQ
jgi:hypothetical protein